jgi:hypothetical protein
MSCSNILITEVLAMISVYQLLYSTVGSLQQNRCLSPKQSQLPPFGHKAFTGGAWIRFKIVLLG